jgi:hypothetical protein
MAKRTKKPIQGVGDVIEKITTFLGVQPCDKCKERKEDYNFNFPIRLYRSMRLPTEQEYKEYKEFQETRTLRLSNDQRKWLCKIYSDILNVSYYEPCPNCSASPYILMIERLDVIFNKIDEDGSN